MIRGFLLPIAMGVTVVIGAAVTYRVLEVLLASYTDYDRGLWEGAIVATAFTSGNALARRVLRYLDAGKDGLP